MENESIKTQFDVSPKKVITSFSIIGLILLLLFTVDSYMSSYNSMIKNEQAVYDKWGNVEVVFQKKINLFDKLIMLTREYAKHERETLTEVIQARSGIQSVNSSLVNNQALLNQYKTNQDNFSNLVNRLLVVFEKYPNLQANEEYVALQEEFVNTENLLMSRCTDYNSAVNDYNYSIKKLPSNIIANMNGFTQKAFFRSSK